MTIFLIGFMGAGKTTYGKALAKEMAKKFIDLDQVIEGKAQKTIAEIFKDEGEETFRIIEKNALQELSGIDAVISTGGGTPCFFNNMAILKSKGKTIYLKVAPRELAWRLEKDDEQRPLLQNRTGNDLITFIEAKLQEREKYYLQSAIILDPKYLHPVKVAQLLWN